MGRIRAALDAGEVIRPAGDRDHRPSAIGRIDHVFPVLRNFTIHSRADEALVRKALATGTEIRSLRHTSAHPEDEIGAWLRFRAEGSQRQALAS